MTATMNRKELNEMELNQVNGGCDPQKVSLDIVQCKRCGDYYLTRNHHICLVLPEYDGEDFPLIGLAI